MQKLLTFYSKIISIYAIFDDQSFNDTLTKHIVSFEQLGPVILTVDLFNGDVFYSPLRTCSFCLSDRGLHLLKMLIMTSADILLDANVVLDVVAILKIYLNS